MLQGLRLLLAALLLAAPVQAQDPNAQPGAPATGSAGATANSTDGDEEVIFDKMVKRMSITKIPQGFEAPFIFVLDVVPKLRPVKKKTAVVNAPVVAPNAELVKSMFSSVKVSSISITRSKKIAVVSVQNMSVRLREGEPTMGGKVTVKAIEPDRVQFQYEEMPPIWIYRIRPGAPPPEVVAVTPAPSTEAPVATVEAPVEAPAQ